MEGSERKGPVKLSSLFKKLTSAMKLMTCSNQNMSLQVSFQFFVIAVCFIKKNRKGNILQVSLH